MAARGGRTAARRKSAYRGAKLIGVANDPEGQARLGAFRRGMQALGWVEGRNVRIVARRADAAENQCTKTCFVTLWESR